MDTDAIYAKGVRLHRLLKSQLKNYPLRTFLCAAVSQPALAARLPGDDVDG